ncbi:MAG: hypothetical protein ACRCSF_06660, partial [Mycobacteriaceae bacterium]
TSAGSSRYEQRQRSRQTVGEFTMVDITGDGRYLHTAGEPRTVTSASITDIGHALADLIDHGITQNHHR